MTQSTIALSCQHIEAQIFQERGGELKKKTEKETENQSTNWEYYNWESWQENVKKFLESRMQKVIAFAFPDVCEFLQQNFHI